MILQIWYQMNHRIKFQNFLKNSNMHQILTTEVLNSWSYDREKQTHNQKSFFISGEKKICLL